MTQNIYEAKYIQSKIYTKQSIYLSLIHISRNLLYTAVTRAKEMVILVGTKDMVAGMIQNNRLSNRYTGLYEEIRENDIQ